MENLADSIAKTLLLLFFFPKDLTNVINYSF